MKKIEVIDPKNLPTRFPIWATLCFAFAMDKWNAPEWLWGAVGLFLLMLWITAIYRSITEERVDILKKRNSNN